MDDRDDEYVSGEDEDFNPEIAAADEVISSSEDEEESTTNARNKIGSKNIKRRHGEEDDELGSGDEATIRESRRKKRRKAEEDDESGGEGGLVKTRAQRAAEKVERQEFRKANKEGVTIDVDAVWSQLSSSSVGRTLSKAAQRSSGPDREDDTKTNGGPGPRVVTTDIQTGEAGGNKVDMVTIRRTYEFAGQTVSEEKVVDSDSAEAKLYRSTQDSAKQSRAESYGTHDGVPLRRPLKRASMFEPNPTGEVKGLPAHKQRLRTPSRTDVLALQKRLDQEMEEKRVKGQKLNTVQKSAIDWAAHVDKQGLKGELDEYGRSKQGYMGKMDFLRNVEGRRDLDERQARLQVS